MKIKRLSILILLTALLFSLMAPTAAALEDPTVEATYTILLETNTDTVLYEKGADTRAYPASLTKMMTALLTIEAIEKQQVKTTDQVTAKAGFDFDLQSDGSSAGILLGETMSLEDLLYCVMLSSANEACNVVAEYVGGSISNFVDMMNARAAELGCTGTHFANTHGLPNNSHFSTARDLSIIASEALNHTLFREICGTRTKTITATNLSAARELSNTNSLINPNDHYGSYLYEGASGIKTGFTSAAGYCLAATATREGMNNIQLLSIVLHSTAYDDNADGALDRYSNFTDTQTLFDWGFDNWSYREILKSTDIIAEAPVAMADGTNSVALRPSTSIVRLLPNDADLSRYQKLPVIYAQSSGETLTAPISAGAVLGEISIIYDGRTVGTASLVASSDVSLSRVLYMKTQLMNTLKLPIVRIVFWLLVLLFAVYITIVVRYRMKRRRYLTKENQLRVAQQLAEEDDERDWFAEDDARRKKTGKGSSKKKPSHASSETHRIPMAAPKADENFKDYFEEFFGKDEDEKK